MLRAPRHTPRGNLKRATASARLPCCDARAPRLRSSLLGIAATAVAPRRRARRYVRTRLDVTPEVSSNWSGYAAISTDPDAPAEFTDVTATWRVPKSTCTIEPLSSAAFWVGLGGYDPASTSLEQLGTGADCDGSSKVPTYYAWWELVPAASVRIPLTIKRRRHDQRRGARGRPEDPLLAQGPDAAHALLEGADDDAGSRHRVRRVDRRGAVGLLGVRAAAARCRSRTSAPSRSRRSPRSATRIPGTLTDAAWTPTAIELISSGSDRPVLRARATSLGDGVGALPGDASSDGRTFSVSWQRNLTPG